MTDQNDLKDEMTLDDLLNDREADPVARAAVIEIRKRSELSSKKPITLKQMTDEVVIPKPLIITPFLPSPGIAWIYAATGVGKTLFTLNVAYAIASGGKFLKFECPQPKKVIYIDGEMSYEQIHKRLMLIQKQNGVLDFDENLCVITPEKFLPFEVPRIDSPEGQEYYTNLIAELGTEVVIFDNLSMLSEFDENKSSEWKPIQRWILKLKAMGISCLIVHHAGKGKDYRGHSKMMDCADSAISLEFTQTDRLESEMDDTHCLKIIYKKGRDISGKDKLPFEATLTVAGWDYQSLENSNMGKILEQVGMGHKQVMIAKENGWSSAYVSKMIRKARSQGLIREEK